ncbi:hypothetical protein SteCoe_5701 [Stentor coeruleus]|uniref:Uncharacterized protein n=1 Tax=Stentor coeruleus TaxID=5963 RepID=A0A1R2CRN3_9CILI|nr:hypothetical protein SteCoe_5701 [Stentor coeruleus]
MVYAVFALVYLVLALITLMINPKVKEEENNPFESQATDRQMKRDDDATDTIPAVGQRFSRPSFKRTDLTIEIPDNDAFVQLGQAAFVVTYFKENCFPFSMKYLASREEKFIKITKWYLTICCELTFSLALVNNFEFNGSRQDYLFICPLTSCLISLIITSIMAFLFMKQVQQSENRFFSKILKYIKFAILLLIWLSCCVYNIIADITKMQDYFIITSLTIGLEILLLEFMRSSLKMAVYVWFKQEKILEDMIDNI